MHRITPLIVLPLAALVLAADPPKPRLEYVRKATRHETIIASFKASGLPAFDGPWHVIGPFDNADGKGFAAAYPPEREIDLKRSYPGKHGPVTWQEHKEFRLGSINDLRRLFKQSEQTVAYLHAVLEAKDPLMLTLSFGSDDALAVWLNGEQVLARDVQRPAAADQDRAHVTLKAGKNQLLVKVCNRGGDWAVYLRPEFPGGLEAQFVNQLKRDFGATPAAATRTQLAAEAQHYHLVTLPIPPEIVLEVGGLAVRPDGKLLCCTRRGDVWLISNAGTEDPSTVQFHKFATGLHEPLGLHLDGKDLYVVQRPELTKLVDKDGDDVADEYRTICNRWGVSGDYHEFAFGPARDRQGCFYVTLNVGFGGGHQAKAPWRGWCVQITPQGELKPFACGLRSPNGVNVSPDGNLFYCDNQGEWVATCKMHHVRRGDYFGHPAGLRSAKDSPFANLLPKPNHDSGMLYDGQAGKNGVKGTPPLSPPCIWFPYDKMGKSASEPIWDTTGGKFGPFAGQCFVGDQTNANILRVYLEKVRGHFQGACFPFRSGFECGINRLCFGRDGSLFAGMTNRGWGSIGGKPFGLQRLVYTGVTPFEIQKMAVARRGFELTFTEPVDQASLRQAGAFSLQSFSYDYWSTYGSPEEDSRSEAIDKVFFGDDPRVVHITMGREECAGRVYELHLQGVKSAAGKPLLHGDAYYTCNQRAEQ